MEVSRVNLEKGYIDIYSFGDIKLHCYQTNDLMNDESYILENKENVLLIEFPAFYDNLEEFEKYVKGLNKNIAGKVFSDHPNGGTILKDVKGYASEGTIKSMKEGTIHNLVTGFEKSFNGAFAKEFHEITDVLADEKVNIGGFELKITYHEENINKSIVESNDITSFIKYKGTQICLWQGDITILKIDAIVNAANSQGLGCFIPCHKCIDNAIHSASGVELRLECNKIMQEIGMLQTGKVFITKGYNLPSKYVIHTVGPIIYENVKEKEILELKNCYINSLELAKENNIKTIAFPCISTGEFRFPKELASKIAIETIKEYLDTNEEYFEKIIFNVFLDVDYKIYLKNLGEIYGRI